MNKIKQLVLDNLPTIWVLAIVGFSFLLAYTHSGAQV